MYNLWLDDIEIRKTTLLYYYQFNPFCLDLSSFLIILISLSLNVSRPLRNSHSGIIGPAIVYKAHIFMSLDPFNNPVM